MTNDPHAQASITAHLSDATTYILTLDPTKMYYFILGEVGLDGKEHFSGAYITSKPSNTGRENIVINPTIEVEPIQSKQKIGNANTPASSTAGLNSYLTLSGGSNLGVYYNKWACGGVLPNLHVTEPTGGHFVQKMSGAKLLVGHPEVTEGFDSTGQPCAIWVYQYWQSTSPVAGTWDSDENKYGNYHANGTFEISLIYRSDPEPYFSFYGTPEFRYRISSCGEILDSGSIMLEPGSVDQPYRITPTIYATAPAQCPGDTPPNRTLTSILAEPASATIYIHPKIPPAAASSTRLQEHILMVQLMS